LSWFEGWEIMVDVIKVQLVNIRLFVEKFLKYVEVIELCFQIEAVVWGYKVVE
jgi:hypothetical protein